MRGLIRLTMITFALASPAAFACGDVADSHDDSFAQMTRPTPNATPVAKSADSKQVAAIKADKRAQAVAPAQPAPLKVAARTPAN